MNYVIRGDHFVVTDALRDYAEKKFGRLERYFEAPLNGGVHVTLGVVKGFHVVEVTVPLQGVILRAEERSDDMYASIDLVMDKLERQIRKHKTKINRKFRSERGSRALLKDSFDTLPTRTVLPEEEDDLELVRTKQFTLKPMDIEEAILQMNMVGHSFFVFSNAESKEVNVVYRRNDGRYGLIEPAR